MVVRTGVAIDRRGNAGDDVVTRRIFKGDAQGVGRIPFASRANRLSYSSYRTIFPTYDENKINKLLDVFKEFGPGNYNLLVTFVIFNLDSFTPIN
jgi:hypothetical protein